MKRLIIVGSLVLLAASLGMSVHAAKPPDGQKGNGLPKIKMAGSWKMNIHAYTDCPSGDFDDSNRRTIVVKAYMGTTHPDTMTFNDIWLKADDSDSFHILDGNACDAGVDDGGADKGALLTLPSLVAYDYQVYVTMRGKPGKKIDAALCAEIWDGDSWEIACSTGVVRTRQNGQDKYMNYSNELLSVPDVYNECTGNRCELFADTRESSAFWDWWGDDQAKASVVFIPCEDNKRAEDDPTTIDCFAP